MPAATTQNRPTKQSPDTLLVKFEASDSEHSVTRNTVKELSKALGLSFDKQVIHYALAQLRDQLLPRYEKDNGPVPGKMVMHLRTQVDQDTSGGQSLL